MVLQKELLQLSTNSWQVIAESSGHLVHLQQPDLVADTILEVMSRYCDDELHAEEGEDSKIAFCDMPSQQKSQEALINSSLNYQSK